MKTRDRSLAELADGINKLAIPDTGLDGQNDASISKRKPRSRKNKQLTSEDKALNKDTGGLQTSHIRPRQQTLNAELAIKNNNDPVQTDCSFPNHGTQSNTVLQPQTHTDPAVQFWNSIARPQHKNQTRTMHKRGFTDLKRHVRRTPEMSEGYKALANEPSQRLDKPRQLLIILDLNGTLGYKSNNSFVHRMDVAKFLRYVVTNHVVMVWSSAMRQNVLKRCTKLFEEVDLPLPDIIWDRHDFRLNENDFRSNVQLYKELWLVWDDPRVQQEAKDTPFDQTNTILIDDTALKAAGQPYNLVEVNELVRGKVEYGELGQVVAYLEQVKYQSNVSAYMKNNPFRLDPNAAPYSWAEVDQEAAEGQANQQEAAESQANQREAAEDQAGQQEAAEGQASQQETAVVSDDEQGGVDLGAK